MRKIYLMIVILTTIVSITTMLNVKKSCIESNNIDVAYNEKILNYDEKNQVVNVDDVIEKNKQINNDNEIKKSDDTKENIDEKANESRRWYIENKNKELMKDYSLEDYEVTEEELNVEFDTYNKRENELNKHVIKKEPDEIVSALSLQEKTKLMKYFSKVPKKEYDNLEEYLSYTNQRAGVRKIMNVLEKYLSNDEMEETKEIMSDYVDIRRVEEY
ncbi:hypothetical protein [Clostridium ihumii]|uniref:hypothetical protein n=1 Tax=Clostridium ihumii TaxID=1470356 RepID=UPI00059149D1|nr:hypothetical protein [Clostridium ihumii]